MYENIKNGVRIERSEIGRRGSAYGAAIADHTENVNGVRIERSGIGRRGAAYGAAIADCQWCKFVDIFEEM